MAVVLAVILLVCVATAVHMEQRSAVLIGVLDLFVGRSLYRMTRHRRAAPPPAVT